MSMTRFSNGGVSEMAAMRADLDQLRGEVAGLRDEVARLRRDLGP